MTNPSHGSAPPIAFQRAVTSLHRASWRRELTVNHTSAPQRLAPYSAGITADLATRGEEIGHARLILLYDPSGNTTWEGTFRCVCFVRADIDNEMATDPLLSSVGWTWLEEAWERHQASHLAPSGTVTCVASESFGALSTTPAEAQIEIRASWTPILEDGYGFTAHLSAWEEIVCTAAGLAPLPDGVIAMPGRVHGVRPGMR